MLRYTKKGIESKERIGTLPLRMSSLLRYDILIRKEVTPHG